jgi:chromosome segregation ATPase
LNREALETLDEKESSFLQEKQMLTMQMNALETRFQSENDQLRRDGDASRQQSEKLETQVLKLLEERNKFEKQMLSQKQDITQLNDQLLQKQEEHQKALNQAMQRVREESQSKHDLETKFAQQRNEEQMAAVMKQNQLQMELSSERSKSETERNKSDTFEKQWKACNLELISIRKARDDLQRQNNTLRDEIGEVKQLKKDKTEKDMLVRQLQATNRELENTMSANKRKYEIDIAQARVKIHRTEPSTPSIALAEPKPSWQA